MSAREMFLKKINFHYRAETDGGAERGAEDEGHGNIIALVYVLGLLIETLITCRYILHLLILPTILHCVL